MIELHAGSATDVGRVRSSNQDVALVDAELFAVADGMGGHVGGEVAARVAVETLRNAFSRQPTVDGLRRAVAEANRAVWRQSQSDTSLRGMGTTLTAMALVRAPDGAPLIALANVGDSRAYVYSAGQLVQVTDDHSLAEEKVRQGELTEAEAAIHPHRHILTRALGVGSDVDVDLWELRLQDGDRILLCSDGLTNEVTDDRIGGILATPGDPGGAANELVRVALESGGNDNITVVVVDIVGEEAPPVPVPVVTSVVEAPPDPITTVVAAAPIPQAFAGDATGIVAVPATPQPTAAAVPAVDGASVATGTVTAFAAATQSGKGGKSAGGAGSRRVGGSVSEGSRLVSSGRGGPTGDDADQRPPSRREKRRARRRAGIPRLVTLRVLVFLILLGGVAYGAYYLIRWYANDDWYVAAASNTHLVVFHGRPGGFLWYKPSVEEACTVTVSEIPTYVVKTVTKRVVEKPSLAAATSYITNLYQDYLSTQVLSSGQTPNPPATTTTTAPVTTTTVAGATTAPNGATTTTPTGPTKPTNPAICKLVTPTNTAATSTTTTSSVTATTAATTTTAVGAG